MADDTLPIQSGILDPLIGAGFFTPNMSLEEIKRRRAIGAAIASRARPFPKTIGEGMTYFGEALAEARAERQLAAAEKGYDERFAKEAGPLRERIGADNTVSPVVTPAPVVAPSPAPVGPTAAVNPLTLEPTSGPANRDVIARGILARNGVVPPGPTVTAGSPPPSLPPAGGPLVSRNASLDNGATFAEEGGNPPTISRDIRPMVMAQAGPPAAPVQPTATPGGTLAPVIPEALPDRPQPVRDENMTKTEKDAWLFWQRTQDPRAKDMFDQAHALGKAARDAKYTREKTDYDRYVAQQIAREALRERARIDAPKTQQELATGAAAVTKAQADEQARLQWGNLPAPVQKDLFESRDAAKAAVGSIGALNNAEAVLNAGTAVGPGAALAMAYHKTRAFAGNAESQRILANTQTFQATLGPAVMAAVKSYGGPQVSNTDREYAAAMVGSDIALSEEAIRRIIDIGKRSAQAALTDHRSKADEHAKDAPALRKFLEVSDPLAAAPKLSEGAKPAPAAPATAAPTGPPRTFASEAEADAANLPKGTPVIINGRRGRIN